MFHEPKPIKMKATSHKDYLSDIHVSGKNEVRFAEAIPQGARQDK